MKNLAENFIQSQNNHLTNIDAKKYGFKPLELIDKAIFSQKFKETQPVISEFTFTNLFMWREYYQFVWKQMKNGDIILISLHDPLKLIAFPLIGSDLDSWIRELEQIKIGFIRPVEIHRVPESHLDDLKKIIPNLEYFEDRDNWDYLYKRKDLLNLPGKHYATIRRKLNKFNKEYPITIEPLSPRNVKSSLQLQEEWCNLRSCSDTPSLENEDKAIRDILLHIDKLDYIGFVVLQENNVIGYSIGEKLNSTTITSHVEKGNTEYFGLYQALNHIFAEKYASNFQYINREQDLGVPGLRRSKESYHPIEFIKKYIVHLK
ncbi:MAG: DUF2156 domain-containing protein [Promethearchaeota archaeon]